MPPARVHFAGTLQPADGWQNVFQDWGDAISTLYTLVCDQARLGLPNKMQYLLVGVQGEDDDMQLCIYTQYSERVIFQRIFHVFACKGSLSSCRENAETNYDQITRCEEWDEFGVRTMLAGNLEC
jgi:hypothetical protein